MMKRGACYAPSMRIGPENADANVQTPEIERNPACSKYYQMELRNRCVERPSGWPVKSRIILHAWAIRERMSPVSVHVSRKTNSMK